MECPSGRRRVTTDIMELLADGGTTAQATRRARGSRPGRAGSRRWAPRCCGDEGTPRQEEDAARGAGHWPVEGQGRLLSPGEQAWKSSGNLGSEGAMGTGASNTPRALPGAGRPGGRPQVNTKPTSCAADPGGFRSCLRDGSAVGAILIWDRHEPRPVTSGDWPCEKGQHLSQRPSPPWFFRAWLPSRDPVENVFCVEGSPKPLSVRAPSASSRQHSRLTEIDVDFGSVGNRTAGGSGLPLKTSPTHHSISDGLP